jgi:hypothetical protein
VWWDKPVPSSSLRRSWDPDLFDTFLLHRLDGNNIGSEGKAAIEEALKHSKTLENLM